MDELLRIYILSSIQEKTTAALNELNRSIDCDLGEGKIREASAEYARRRKMESAFIEFCENLPEVE